MRRKFLSLLIMLTTCVTSNAQATISLQQLEGTKWLELYPCAPEDIHVALTFSKTDMEFVSTYQSSKNTVTYKHPYYLNYGIPSEFDFTQVGKANKGTYIIKYNTKMNDFNGYQFVSLKGDTLTLHSKPRPGVLIVGSKYGQRMRFKRIK